MTKIPDRYDKQRPLKKRLVELKKGLVVQLVTRRGEFWEAVAEVRGDWQIRDVPAQLPPESADVLLPESVGTPGDSTKEYTAWLNRKRRWHGSLRYVLAPTEVERYLGEEGPPYNTADSPPLPLKWLPWYRFAAACVLYDPPKSEELPKFAKYGGRPALLGDPDGAEPAFGLLSSHDLLKHDMGYAMREAADEYVNRKVWELRGELAGLDFAAARQEVYRRFGPEIERAAERVGAQYRDMIDAEDPPTYYVEVDPSANANERRAAVEAVAARVGSETKDGRPPRDPLKALTIAILKDDRGWKQGKIAEHYGWVSVTHVDKWVREGQKIKGATR